jgi:ubiquinone/menaquinone biosynthesis C-methylase UbiE
LLESLADPLTFDVIKELGTSSSARCLEVGAGAGSVARWLAEKHPDGEVVA